MRHTALRRASLALAFGFTPCAALSEMPHADSVPDPYRGSRTSTAGGSDSASVTFARADRL